MEKKPELIADKGRVRSKEDEEALDKKIAEIRKKNQLIEQRKELVEEDRANFINEYGKISLDNEAKGTMYRNKQILKPKKSGEWDREWDAGKISVENWKENVPDIGDNVPNTHFLRGFKNRRSDNIRNNKSNSDGNSAKNNAKAKKIVEIMKKQKLEDRKVIVCNETNKNASLERKKIFSGKNAKKLRNCNNGNDDNGNVSYNMKLMSRLKQSHAFSNRQANRKSTGNYKKLPSPSELPKKRHSIRRITSTASVTLLTTTVTQQLDTVKVNVSMLELKKDAQNIAKSNNNTGKVDNNRQKLAGIVAETAAISAASIQSIAEEYEVSDNDIIMMEDVRKLMEEILLQMK
ncbi:E3 ubiquitin-protein ligase XIAP [Dirofilaria immitis]